jgi:hypothetical protein
MSSSSDSRSAPSKPSTPDTPALSTSASKSRPRFTLPGPGSSEFVPALATGALILLIALQIALPYATELPADTGLAPRRARALKVPAIPPYPALAQDDIFDPSRQRGDHGSPEGAADALQVVGVVSSSRGGAALIGMTGATARFVRAGESVGGWKLVSVAKDAVWVQKGDVRRRLAVGATPPGPTPATAGSGAPQSGNATE